MDMEIDLSNLGTANTMFAALFSKLCVPIKTTISANVLEEALSRTVTFRPLSIGTSVSGKGAHFLDMTITEEHAEADVVVRVTSAAHSKFKGVQPLLDGVLSYLPNPTEVSNYALDHTN